ncbi:MAG TPA: CBS domain-containing protein [Mariprofundaceae bacterium]|nr:CBS domain-containing protein [Mariprofundaceae bacterium]
MTLFARDIMNDNPPYCELDTPLSDIARRFAEGESSGLMVVDEEKRLIGVITESDLLEQQGSLHLPTVVTIFDLVIPLGEARFEEELERLQAMTASDLMSQDIKTIKPDTPLEEVATLMSDRNIHHLPVLDSDTVVGSISKHDMVKALAGKLGTRR